MSKWGAKP